MPGSRSRTEGGRRSEEDLDAGEGQEQAQDMGEAEAAADGEALWREVEAAEDDEEELEDNDDESYDDEDEAYGSDEGADSDIEPDEEAGEGQHVVVEAPRTEQSYREARRLRGAPEVWEGGRSTVSQLVVRVHPQSTGRSIHLYTGSQLPSYYIHLFS